VRGGDGGRGWGQSRGARRLLARARGLGERLGWIRSLRLLLGMLPVAEAEATSHQRRGHPPLLVHRWRGESQTARCEGVPAPEQHQHEEQR
jgi:hypothetical protein